MHIVPLNEYAAEAAPGSRDDDNLRGLLNSLPAVILRCSQDGRILSVSDRWWSLTGVRPADSLGRELLEFILPEDHSLLAEHFSTSLPRGPINQTLRFLDKSGRTGWIQIDLHETQLEDGAGGYVGLITDITDRVGREASLLAQHRTLSGILDDLPGMVFRCRNDPDWTMEYVSGGSLALTGYRPGEIINNRRLSYGSLIVPEDRTKVWDGVQSAIRARRSYDLDYRIETESGDIRHVWERAKGVYSSGNDLLGLEGFITDITRYRQRFQPLRPGDLYLEDGETLTRILLEDRVRHRMQQMNGEADRKTRDGFAVVCIHFDNLGARLEDASDGLHAGILSALIRRIRSLIGRADGLHVDVTGQALLLLDRVSRPEELETWTDNLQTAFFDPVEIDGLQILLTLSIGATLCSEPLPPMSPVSRAEQVMREISETGGNNWRVVG